MSRAKNLPKTLAQSRKRPQPKALPESGLFLPGRNLIIFVSALLAAATITLYSPVIGTHLSSWMIVSTSPQIHTFMAARLGAPSSGHSRQPRLRTGIR